MVFSCCSYELTHNFSIDGAMGYIDYSPFGSGMGPQEKTAKRARLLLEGGPARVHRLVSFTIRLIDGEIAAAVTEPAIRIPCLRVNSLMTSIIHNK